MTKRNDGGAAFPMLGNVAHNSDWLIEHGMSLRDWFAGQALAGIMTMVAAGAHNLPEPKGAVGCATEAYRLADAMLSARSLSPKDQQP